MASTPTKYLVASFPGNKVCGPINTSLAEELQLDKNGKIKNKIYSSGDWDDQMSEILNVFSEHGWKLNTVILNRDHKLIFESTS